MVFGLDENPQVSILFTKKKLKRLNESQNESKILALDEQKVFKELLKSIQKTFRSKFRLEAGCINQWTRNRIKTII